MTRAQTEAFNAGVLAVLKIARRSAVVIGTTTAKRNHAEFAVAALTELHDAGRALLIQTEEDGK